MRLENLYTNFGLMSVEDQSAFVHSYRARRQADLDSTKPVPVKARAASAKGSKIELSETEKALMKSLGIKVKDLAILRSMVEIESSPADDTLFNETTFEGGEDE